VLSCLLDQYWTFPTRHKFPSIRRLARVNFRAKIKKSYYCDYYQ
jgi:hypothetical protein